MRQECVENISLVKGRKITSEEGDRMVREVEAEIRRLAQTMDPAEWGPMSRDERAVAAAKSLAERGKAEAAEKIRQMNLQILRQDELGRTMVRKAERENVHAFSAVASVLRDISNRAKGVMNEYLSGMMDTVNGIGSKWLGFVEDANDVRDFAREVFGAKTGNERAAKAAKAWLDTSEAMRQRAVRAGAEIGRLDYGYLPQSHDWWRIKKAGGEAWMNDILPLLDTSRFVNDFGGRMSRPEIMEVLSGSCGRTVTSGRDCEGPAGTWPEHQAAAETTGVCFLHAYRGLPRDGGFFRLIGEALGLTRMGFGSQIKL